MAYPLQTARCAMSSEPVARLREQLALRELLGEHPLVALHGASGVGKTALRSEEHTSELQSPCNLVCRLLLEKKKKNQISIVAPAIIRSQSLCYSVPASRYL